MPDLLTILDENDQYVVVDKPVGLLSVPGRGEHKLDSVTTRVRELYPDATGSVTVHRLDQDTSGIMVLALNAASHRALSRQFMHRKTGKRYEAILDGDVLPSDGPDGPDEGAVELPLIVDWPNRPKQMVCCERGKPARTLWRVLERFTSPEGWPLTRIEFRPITGRGHQLRVHSMTPRNEGGIGCAILGDPLYSQLDGDGNAKRPRMMLHAAMLSFWHPTTGEWTVYESPAPF
ncbi:MAG: RluA family pseudouridine synthase [Planctomycetota bacterium]